MLTGESTVSSSTVQSAPIGVPAQAQRLPAVTNYDSSSSSSESSDDDSSSEDDSPASKPTGKVVLNLGGAEVRAVDKHVLFSTFRPYMCLFAHKLTQICKTNFRLYSST